ncbi:MAG TPA: SPOR domain-containing protein [Acidobacteriota bacterium]|nr:SPOR domain-containing protein [Acidobacteriota bacterium]
MKNKDFREIQVSSSLLVVIFLGVLALGVFIFLLGVSVGKKQAGATAPTQIVTQQIPEPVKEPPVKPTSTESASEAMATNPIMGDPRTAAENPALKPSVKETASVKPPASKAPAETKKAPAVSSSGLYYVQVGAFTERSQAQAAADQYKKQGYAAVVADPKPSDAKTWYRVRLGGYPSRDRAVSLLDKLNAAAGKKTDFRVVQD